MKKNQLTIACIMAYFLLSNPAFATDSTNTAITPPVVTPLQKINAKVFFEIKNVNHGGEGGFWAGWSTIYSSVASCPPGSTWEGGFPSYLGSETSMNTRSSGGAVQPGELAHDAYDYNKCICAGNSDYCPPGMFGYAGDSWVVTWTLCSITVDAWTSASNVTAMQAVNTNVLDYTTYIGGSPVVADFPFKTFMYCDGEACVDYPFPAGFANNYNPKALPHIRFIDFSSAGCYGYP